VQILCQTSRSGSRRLRISKAPVAIVGRTRRLGERGGQESILELRPTDFSSYESGKTVSVYETLIPVEEHANGAARLGSSRSLRAAAFSFLPRPHVSTRDGT
jgi:hypothetical protein